MSDWLVSPPAETDWRLDADDFAARVADRWPGAQITRFPEDGGTGALDFELEGVWGTLHADGQAVALNGDVPACAPIAAWLREVVAPEQALIFWDPRYETVVALMPGITAREIEAAVTG